MSRNIVPRANKDADLGTPAKNWNKLYADTVVLRGNDLHALLDGKTDLNILTAKGDLYVATDAGIITRLPAGEDGYVLKSNSGITEGLMWGPAGARQELTGDITVTVGDGGDFPTINAALENIVALYYPKYISGGNCPRVTIHLNADFVMAEQVLVDSLDLSWITIEGEDDETIINRSALTKAFISGTPAFGVSNGGCLPIIGQLFNMDTSEYIKYKVGLAARRSRAIILSNCGVKNTGDYGLIAVGSIIDAGNTIFSGAGRNGIMAASFSMINAQGANASGANSTCIKAELNSYINAQSAIASGAINYDGIAAEEGSIVNAQAADVSGAGRYGVFAFYGSTINAQGAIASDTGSYSIRIWCGSIINAYEATIKETGGLSTAANTITPDGIIFRNV